MSDNKIIKAEVEFDDVERVEDEGMLLEIGQWYWVKDTARERVRPTDEGYDPEQADEPGAWYFAERKIEWLGCITHIGSNVVELSRAGAFGKESKRIHVDVAHKNLTPAPEWREVVRENVQKRQENVARLMGEVQEITRKLGMSPRLGLPTPQKEQSYALATLSGTEDVKGYETALVKAQKEELPALFKKIKNENELMANWLKAETLPLVAMAGSMESVIGKIEDRIFNVSLYAGLTEQVHKVRDGEPAGYDEKLHLLQRKHYMDEECLANYRTGGMDFKSMDQFDAWLCEPDNFERILPYPRCMVAFQVRRNTKEREWGGDFGQALINMRLADADRTTYLYIRNGEQLYWLGCDLDFDDWIFPKKGGVDFANAMMVKKDYNRYETITVDDYEVRCAKQMEILEKRVAWEKENPFKQWKVRREKETGRTRWPWWKDEWERANPHHRNEIIPSEWHTFDPGYLYYDEVMAKIEKEVKYYNRVALIIQGLYDRSEILHPHPPVKTWTPEGFAAAVELIYDGSNILYDGDPPSFEDYVARCNESIDENSVLIGQDEFWQRKEAEKWNNDSRRHRGRYDRDVEFYSPWGNPGPGFLARPDSWKPRARKATFAWNRERQTSSYYDGKRFGDPIRTTITVPADKLFNVSAYKPGDYLIFFRDPRTRAQYLKWAPALLTAEEYHAGNIKAQEPVQQ